MSVHVLTAEGFEKYILEHTIVFIDFWAEWCAPCKAFAEIYEQVAAQNPHIKFAKVNIEQEKTLADILHLQSIPHLMIFKEGIAIYSEAGTLPLSVLNELITQACMADVSSIRARLEEEK
ncbi:MAG: thioredoxin family protein [Legionella sp.]|nr:thioredoxin family protein [Legionella sp.]